MRSASKDRRGKEKERRRQSRGRWEAEAVAERERKDRGARRNPGTAKEGKKKKSAFNFLGLNSGGTVFLDRDICYPEVAGGEPEPKPKKAQDEGELKLEERVAATTSPESSLLAPPAGTSGTAGWRVPRLIMIIIKPIITDNKYIIYKTYYLMFF